MQATSKLCSLDGLEAGADDVGVVALDEFRAELGTSAGTPRV